MTAYFARRQIKTTIYTGQGSYGESGFSSLVIEGLRTTAEVAFVTQGSPECIVRIFGLTLSQINQLSNTGLFWQVRANNRMLVEAGDENSQLSEIFDGEIFQAYPDFLDQPEVSFVLVGIAGRTLRQKPIAPTHIEGSATAQQVFEQIAQKSGLTLENNGVNTSVSDPYFFQTAWNQFQAAADTFNCFWTLDSTKKLIAIWPKNGGRTSAQLNLIAPETGMIGYPEFQKIEVKVRTLFLPTVEIGGQVQIRSQLTAASGKFQVVAASHHLEAHMPGGLWETWVTGVPFGRTVGNNDI